MQEEPRATDREAERVERVCALFAQLFAHDPSDAIELSNAGTAELGLSRRGFTYGETSLQSLLHVLRAADLRSYCCTCCISNSHPHQRCERCGLRPAGAAIVDLGSGRGNVVVGIALMVASSLVRAASVQGVELLPPLHHAAVAAIQSLHELAAADAAVAELLQVPLPPSEVTLNDIMAHDLSDVDVCYLCSTAFTPELITRWSAQAARTLRPGSTVISLSKPLSHIAFEQTASLPCEASWGPERAYIHSVLPPERVRADTHEANALAGLLITSADNGRSAWTFTAFDLRAVSSKGLGAFSRRAYSAGDRIFSEAPLALLVVADRNRVVRQEGVALIQRVVSALSERRRAAYFALSQAAWHGPTRTALGIWLSNAYPMDEGDAGGGTRQAVFAQICRINHACNPNVIISWNAALRMQTVHAARPIARDEELTASFYGADGCSGMLRLHRQQQLARQFHFECACELCALVGEPLARSEARQRRLIAISSCICTSPPPEYQPLVALVREATGLLRDEGLPASWAKGYMLRLVCSAADAGDAKAAGQWASRAASCAREACGVDSSSYLSILQ